MCFRPPTVSPPIQCPECGKDVSTMGGGSATCPHCGADIRKEMEAAGVTLRGEVASPGIGAPTAPTAPKQSNLGAPVTPGGPTQ